MKRTLLVAAFLLPLMVFVTGCKLAVTVTSGGDVRSLSGTRDCPGGTTCEFEVTDANFEETFIAIPRKGYVFSNWEAGLDGERYQCRGSTHPVCVVRNTALKGNASAQTLIEQGTIYYALPRFEYVGIDTDGDGVKDDLDEDDDNDGVADVSDNCPLAAPNQDGFGCPGRPTFTLIFFT